MNWFLLHIKNNEKQKVIDIFNQMNIETFCPIISIDSNYSLEQQQNHQSYIFAKLAKKYRGIIFGFPDVIGYFFSEGKVVLASDEDIEKYKHGEVYSFKNLKTNAQPPKLIS